jgi:hypothetical protein
LNHRIVFFAKDKAFDPENVIGGFYEEWGDGWEMGFGGKWVLNIDVMLVVVVMVVAAAARLPNAPRAHIPNTRPDRTRTDHCAELDCGIMVMILADLNLKMFTIFNKNGISHCQRR